MVMIESHNKGTLLSIRVKPRSKRQAIIFAEEDACSIHVKAAPTRGQANIEVIKFLAKTFGIPTNRIQIIVGEKSSTKILLIEGMTPQSVKVALKGE